MPPEDYDPGPESDGGLRASVDELSFAPAVTVPVVGLGASAGGIEALTQLFDAMPPDSGWAFVVVLHLDPTRESQLSSILSHHTAMPVEQIEDGMVVLPNQVYVIAPDQDLRLEGNTLHLTKPGQPRGHRHPIDVFFQTLADQRQQRAAGIILSGTGTNGTQGLKEIKAAGGLIVVQDPATAAFDGMPRSAISAGLADHILAPGDVPPALLRYFRHRYLTAPDSPATTPADERFGFEQIVGLLRSRSGHEFHSYKPATLFRRINRRMSLRGLTEIGDYLDLLRAEPNEVQALIRDLLISVTSFFRDSEAWATLDETVITQLVAGREDGASIRVWAPACATGEEPYSIAMLLTERAEAAHKQFELKVFASDIIDDNLNAARAGVYPGSSVEMLPADRVRRFFEKLDGSYQVRKPLRDLVVFAHQDLLRDPPFSRMDLICCRNMLIYIEPEAQRRAIALFHFALREGGRLFLGSAETIGRADDLFETVSKKWRIYRRLGATRHDIVSFPTLGGHLLDRTGPPSFRETPARVTETARRALLERYAPAAVLIDRNGKVLYFHGDTSDYLKQPSGEPTRDLLAMAREGLLGKLHEAIHQAPPENRHTRFSAQVGQGRTLRMVTITISPLPAVQNEPELRLITFEPEARKPKTPRRPAPAIEPDRKQVTEATSVLEAELRSTRAELQSAIQQLEGANEELKAANEEATSVNEELQSTNEELETSKEELQSFNEELHSINTQLQHKIKETEEISNDLANLLAGTEIATVFLDTDFRIKWFSPVTHQLLDLVSSDVGRPLSHFARKFSDENLLEDAETVLAKLIPTEIEVRATGDRWFLRRILPYRTRDNRIAGLVITFFDITASKRANEAINEARVYAEAIVTTARQPLIILDAGLRVRSANVAFYKLFNTTSEQTEGFRLYEVGNREWDIPQLRQLLEEVLPKDEQFQNVEVAFGSEGLDRRTMLLNARRLQRNGGREGLILLAIEEITERKHSAAHQELLIGELNHRVKNALATAQAIMNQTLRHSGSLEEFKSAFEGRLHALARAHDLLAQQKWAGSNIGQIISHTLAPYQIEVEKETKVKIEGVNATVSAQVGMALVLVLHELATNAAKYGALSVPAGRLAVTWHLEGAGAAERLHLAWTESGGPTVTPPTRRGFGTKLIERSTQHELGGKALLEYRESGLRCELVFPRRIAGGHTDVG